MLEDEEKKRKDIVRYGCRTYKRSRVRRMQSLRGNTEHSFAPWPSQDKQKSVRQPTGDPRKVRLKLSTPGCQDLNFACPDAQIHIVAIRRAIGKPNLGLRRGIQNQAVAKRQNSTASATVEMRLTESRCLFDPASSCMHLSLRMISS